VVEEEEEVEEVMSDVQMRNARFGQASQELCRAGAEEHVAKANHSAQLGRDLSAFQDKRAGKARVPRKTMGVFCLPWMDCVDTLGTMCTTYIYIVCTRQKRHAESSVDGEHDDHEPSRHLRDSLARRFDDISLPARETQACKTAHVFPLGVADRHMTCSRHPPSMEAKMPLPAAGVRRGQHEVRDVEQSSPFPVVAVQGVVTCGQHNTARGLPPSPGRPAHANCYSRVPTAPQPTQ